LFVPEEGPPIRWGKANAYGSAGSQQVGPGIDRLSKLKRWTIWHDLSKSIECLWAEASTGVNAPNGNVHKRILSPKQQYRHSYPALFRIIPFKALVSVSTAVCIYLRLLLAFI
jgi:hypothetical protein